MIRGDGPICPRSDPVPDEPGLEVERRRADTLGHRDGFSDLEVAAEVKTAGFDPRSNPSLEHAFAADGQAFWAFPLSFRAATHILVRSRNTNR